MLTTQVRTGTNVVTVDYGGHLDAEEMIAFREVLHGVIAEHGEVRLLARYGDVDLAHVELRAFWEDLKNAAVIRHIERCAIVADQRWLRRVSEWAGTVLPTQLETFDLASYDAAMTWIIS